MKNLICIPLVIFATFSYAQNANYDKVITPKIVSKLKLNSSYKAKNLEVKLVEVVSDSRCPKGVSCVWAGEVIVLVDVYKNGEKVKQKRVSFNSNKENIIFSSETVSIIGYNVMPYPENNVKINPEDYYLQLEVKDLLQQDK